MFKRSTPSFERSLDERLDLEEAHRRAKEVLSAERVKESDFSDVYPQEKIVSDKEKATSSREKFDREREEDDWETKKMADVLEAIVLEQGELGQRLGEDAFTQGASEFDDYVNGVDLLVEFRNPRVS